MTNELTRDAFAQWASALGIEAGDDHLDLLYAEVRAMRDRVAALSAIDVSDIDPGEAFIATRAT